MKIKKQKYTLYIIISVVVILLSVIAAITTYQLFKHTHVFGEWEIYKDPSCTEFGIERRYCDCGEIQEKRNNKLDHIESDWIFDKESNERKTVCTVCGRDIKVESLDDHIHVWSEWGVDKEPTCTEQGNSTRRCECGMSESMSFAATGHEFSNWKTIKAASCGVNGSKERKCSKCDTVETETVSALSHAEGDWIMVESEKRFLCVHCGTILRVEEIEVASDLEIIDGIVISIGACNNSDIEIPSSHNGVAVTAIGDSAFYKNKNITSIIIPDSITAIGEKAFWGCENIKAIVLPDNVEIIGERAFAYCSQLESISIGASLKELGIWAFEYCANLKSIHFSGTIQEWNDIPKDKEWDLGMSDYTIYCKDGNIEK